MPCFRQLALQDSGCVFRPLRAGIAGRDEWFRFDIYGVRQAGERSQIQVRQKWIDKNASDEGAGKPCYRYGKCQA